jgi:hypothetical protein
MSSLPVIETTFPQLEEPPGYDNFVNELKNVSNTFISHIEQDALKRLRETRDAMFLERELAAYAHAMLAAFSIEAPLKHGSDESFSDASLMAPPS